MKIHNFSEIEETFQQRVQRIVWCNMATVDNRGRPRSRIVHPLWEGATGWICTHRTSYKSKHLLRNPYVSLAYVADVMNPVYVDCRAEWVEDLETKQRVWDLFKNTPEPVGFDPAQDFVRPDYEDFGLLRLAPWRIALVSFPAPSHEEGQQIWHNSLETAPDGQ